MKTPDAGRQTPDALHGIRRAVFRVQRQASGVQRDSKVSTPSGWSGRDWEKQ
tara:strand:- start:2964 stop:3119 length:156 start_codon:yes stop_codon:yes gene_type:complete